MFLNKPDGEALADLQALPIVQICIDKVIKKLLFKICFGILQYTFIQY